MISAKARRVIRAELAAVDADNRRRLAGESLEGRHARYADCSAVTADANGDFAGHVPKGGFWNDATGMGRFGLTGTDLSRIRGKLRRLGAKGDVLELDGAIYSELYESESARPSSNPYAAAEADPGITIAAFIPRPAKAEAMTPAERARRKRQRKRMLNLCTECPAKPGTPAMPGKTVCAACNAAAYERVKAARKGEPAPIVVEPPAWMLRIPGEGT